MGQYAIHDGSTIINVIMADSQEIAENFTNKQAFEITSPVGIGWVLINGSWEVPSPYPSWNFVDKEWKAPIDKPDDDKPYAWSEETRSWVETI
jgi:hypothetical protein